MRSTFLTVLGATGALAFPSIIQKRDVAQPGCTTSKQCNAKLAVSNAQAAIPATPNAFTEASAARSNCGELGVCNTFDASQQYVSTTGANKFIAPGKHDIRGPCPGLNAAANHGYLPRNGMPNIIETANGLQNAYNMPLDFGAFLAVFSIVNSGDLVTLTWSIGGPLPQSILSGVTGTPQGISYSHNFYEGDTSITRCDAYTNFGDAHSSSPTRYTYVTEYFGDDDNFTPDKVGQLYAKNTVRSVKQNALYFAPLVSTTVVSPAAYNFVVNFMSNHSAASPGGYLPKAIFDSFFSYVPNSKGVYTWVPGHERIPDNWYKRPDQNPYGAANLVADLPPDFLAYPDSFRFGGNINGKNTYTGIDISNITGGVYNADTLFQGDNLGCFLLLNFQQVVPLQLQGGVNDVGSAVALLNQYLPSYFSSLQCPQVSQYDTSFLSKYPGGKYQPTAAYNARENC